MNMHAQPCMHAVSRRSESRRRSYHSTGAAQPTQHATTNRKNRLHASCTHTHTHTCHMPAAFNQTLLSPAEARVKRPLGKWRRSWWMSQPLLGGPVVRLCTELRCVCMYTPGALEGDHGCAGLAALRAGWHGGWLSVAEGELRAGRCGRCCDVTWCMQGTPGTGASHPSSGVLFFDRVTAEPWWTVQSDAKRWPATGAPGHAVRRVAVKGWSPLPPLAARPRHPASPSDSPPTHRPSGRRAPPSTTCVAPSPSPLPSPPTDPPSFRRQRRGLDDQRDQVKPAGVYGGRAPRLALVPVGTVPVKHFVARLVRQVVPAEVVVGRPAGRGGARRGGPLAKRHGAVFLELVQRVAVAALKAHIHGDGVEVKGRRRVVVALRRG